VLVRAGSSKLATQALYVQRNTKPRWDNHCCSGRAVIVTYCACVSVALGIQLATHMRHIAICGLLRSTIFFHIISQTEPFKKNVIELKMCLLIFSTTFVRKISHSKKNWVQYDLNVYWSTCKVPFILVLV
jgi:hypothetical protein